MNKKAKPANTPETTKAAFFKVLKQVARKKNGNHKNPT
jgi:hypothetical protein